MGILADLFLIILLDIQIVHFIMSRSLDGEKGVIMYVKLYNMEPEILSTLVKRKQRKEGFDLYMPLIYKKTIIPYKTGQFTDPLTLQSEPSSKF